MRDRTEVIILRSTSPTFFSSLILSSNGCLTGRRDLHHPIIIITAQFPISTNLIKKQSFDQLVDTSPLHVHSSNSLEKVMISSSVISHESRKRFQNAFRNNRRFFTAEFLDTRIYQKKRFVTNNNVFGHSQPRLFQLDQVRSMGRKGGASAFSKVRTPTRKQRKKFHRRKRELYQEKVGKHSKPGAKAGPRREYKAREMEYLIDKAQGNLPEEDPEMLEYDFGNALIDDLMGNSAHPSTSTIRPVNLANRYKRQHALVSRKMAAYLDFEDKLSLDTDNEDKDVNVPPLPTDMEISILLRSFRDKHSTKSNPLGITRALKFIIQKMKVPSSLFGENTYTTLMTCAASPKEARRIMKLMKDNSHRISAYSYSILVDIHSRTGDFRGADEVLSEMRFEKIEPTLAAYTSLLAGCYKVINRGAMPQSIKAEAGVLAWDRWKEMRIRALALVLKSESRKTAPLRA